MSPGTPFSPNIRAYLLYLHHSHHVGFERLSRLMQEMFGLKISDGAIANSFERKASPLEAAPEAIRDHLRDSTLRQYHAKADRRLDRLLGAREAHPAGRILQAQAKAWRLKFFVFLQDRRVPATNNISEREIRTSVVFRKVTGGFRSD